MLSTRELSVSIRPIMIRANLIFFLLIAFGCNRLEESRNENFSDLYQKWELSVQTKLDSGYSKIYGNKYLVTSLSAIAHLHENELMAKLKTNMFVYAILDSSDKLVKKYKISSFSGDVSSQQQKWLKACLKSNNK